MQKHEQEKKELFNSLVKKCYTHNLSFEYWAPVGSIHILDVEQTEAGVIVESVFLGYIKKWPVLDAVRTLQTAHGAVNKYVKRREQNE